MKKTCLIKQPIGLGDVFYLQKFATILVNSGYEIIWPLRDDVIWIRDYVKTEGVSFCKLSEDFVGKEFYYSGQFVVEKDDFLFISPDGFKLPDRRIMDSKYCLINSSDEDWYNYFFFTRNTEKENKLFYEVLGLSDDSEYIFWNNLAGVEFRTSNVLDNISFDLPIVKLQIIEGYTVFDWCKVFENASEIHTVHTGINYIIDKLTIKAKKYIMYQGTHVSDVQYIPFSKKPIFVPS